MSNSAQCVTCGMWTRLPGDHPFQALNADNVCPGCAAGTPEAARRAAMRRDLDSGLAAMISAAQELGESIKRISQEEIDALTGPRPDSDIEPDSEPDLDQE